MELMVGVESAPLAVLTEAEVPVVAERLLDRLLVWEEAGMLSGPVVHGDEHGRTLGARFFIEADSRSEAVRRAEDLILHDLIGALTATVGTERLPAGTTVGVEGVQLQPALRHIEVDAGPWPELGVA
jgi:hypothetical protein